MAKENSNGLKVGISEQIKDSYLHYMSNCGTGLVLAPLPTAIGKTYSACQAIAEYVKLSKGAGRKIVFTTPLLKNLPEDDLRKAFLARNIDYEEYVVKVKSNEDCIRDAENKHYFEKIPDQYQYIVRLPCCVEMRDNLKKLEEVKDSKNSSDKKLAEVYYSPRFSTAERKFRDAIHALLRDTAKCNKIDIDSLLEYDQFKWVSLIYPQVSNKYQVYVMSMMKLLMGDCRIVKKYRYMSEEWLQDKVIFIDEWDSTKSDVIRCILRPYEVQSDYGIDLMQLFASIWDVLKSPQSFSEELRSVGTKLEKYRKQLLEEADKLDRKYHITSPYHYAERYAEQTPYFMYFCASWLTAARDKGKGYVWAKWNGTHKAMDIHTGSREEWKSTNKNDTLSVNGILNNINQFIRHFVQFLSYWALQWSASETKLREGRNEPEFSYSSAVNSLLHKFRLSNEAKQMLLNNFQLVQRPTHEKRHARPYSYYKRGFTWFSFYTSEETLDDTVIRMLKISDTAEGIMLFLSRNALVLGLSATATCPAILGNYSLPFLRDELLFEDNKGNKHNDFHNILTENPVLASEVKTFLSRRYAKYGKEILVENPQLLDNVYSAALYQDGILDKFIKDEKLSLTLEKLMDGALRTCGIEIGSDSYIYYKSRYCNIALTMYYFASHREHQTCLCVNMKLPGNEKSTLCLSVLKEIEKRINIHYQQEFSDWGKTHKEDIDVFVIDSRHFNETRLDFDERLQKGDRLFIISTFSTIAAGQNLQHPICDWVREYLVCIDKNDGRDISKKDIDELAILDLTNNTVNITDYDNFGLNEQLGNIIQLEECHAEGSINMREKESQITHGFRIMPKSIKGHGWKSNIINMTDQPSLQCTHWVVQTDGRTKRSPWRTRLQTMYIDKSTLYALDIPYLTKMHPYLSPEMKKLYEISCGKERIKSNREKAYIIEARDKALNGKGEISRMLNSIDLSEDVILWGQSDHDEWVRWRDLVLRHAGGIDQDVYDSDIFFRDYYMPAPDGVKASSCLYYDIKDFNEIDISYDSKIDFEKFLREKYGEMYVSGGISTMSEDMSRLKTLMLYEGRHESMKEFFKSQGWSTEWSQGEWIMSPVLFQEIYLGALGEVAGQHIIEDLTSWKLSPIDDLNKFEAFDAQIKGLNSVYVDFKYHRYFGETDKNVRKDVTESIAGKIRHKMRIIGARAVFIIGIIAPEILVEPRKDGDIYYIPDLMFSDGSADMKAITWLDKQLEELKTTDK